MMGHYVGNSSAEEPPNLNAQKFYDMLNASKKPISKCNKKYNELSLGVRMMSIKAENNTSQHEFNQWASLIKDTHEDPNNVPGNYYETKKLLRGLGLTSIKIDCCINGCMTYYKDDAELMGCKFCKHPRFKPRRGGNAREKTVPYKRMHYLPLTPRLQRLCTSPNSAEHMRWHVGGASGSNPDMAERMFIGPRGNEFTAQTVCARRISTIISQKFNGPWRSYRAAPIEVRDLWFSQFELEFTWDEGDRGEIRRIFDTVGSNVLKNRLYEAKTSNKRPGWITPLIWAALQQEWAQQPYKKVSDINKKNRSSVSGGKGFPMHVGGSISHKTHINRLRETVGREPTVHERFMHTHSRLTAQGERVWVDERSRGLHEKYIETFESPASDGGSNTTPTTPTPVATQIERWSELAGSSKKGKVYGLGRLTDYPSSHTTGSRHRERERELETQVQGLKDVIDQMRDRQTRQDASMDELRSQVALLTSTMMAQQRPHLPFPSTRPVLPFGSSPAPQEGTQGFVPTPFYPPHPMQNENSEDDGDETE